MGAIENLTDNVAKLTTAVDNAVAAGIGGTSGVPEEAVQAGADAVQTQTDRLIAATPAPATGEPAPADTTGGADEGASVNPPA